MDVLLNPFTSGIGFLLTLLFGFWLSRLGKPYNGALFNIHKLIALGVTITAGMQLYKIFSDLNVHALIVILLVIAGICVVALFASGAFLSIGNLDYTLMKRIHNIAPIILVSAAVLMIYLLPGTAVTQ